MTKIVLGFSAEIKHITQFKFAIAVLHIGIMRCFYAARADGPRAEMLGYLAGELHDKVLSKEFRALLQKRIKAAPTPTDYLTAARHRAEIWREVDREEASSQNS